MLILDKDLVLKRIEEYSNNLGYSNDISKRFVDMYIKEMNHLIEMNNKFSKLENFNRILCGRIFKKEEFVLKDNDDLFYKSITNVNKITRQIFNCF